MAFKRLTIEGYGQIELNNVAFRRDGRIEAQCAPDTTDFASDMVENGMILKVDNVNHKVNYCNSTVDELVAIVYSAEHIYDERTPGLKSFALKGNGAEDFLPRLGYLAVGDKFHTNCLGYDSTEFANDSAVLSALASYKTTPVYGFKSAKGAIALSTAKATNYQGPVMKVIASATMPDGRYGVQLQVIND